MKKRFDRDWESRIEYTENVEAEREFSECDRISTQQRTVVVKSTL